LAAAYPTLQQLLGEESFAALARDFWRRQPPTVGDMGLWGGDLATFVAAAQSLAPEPYLADMARLEWAVHQAERAADSVAPLGLDLLATQDPAALWLQFAPGTALMVSAHPVATIWLAHRSGAEDRYAPVRAAFAAGAGEAALVVRQGWRAQVVALPCTGEAGGEARFTAAVLAGRPLAQALQDAGEGFDFEPWLITALQAQRLTAVATAPHAPSLATLSGGA
jgi:hypothetical protein